MGRGRGGPPPGFRGRGGPPSPPGAAAASSGIATPNTFSRRPSGMEQSSGESAAPTPAPSTGGKKSPMPPFGGAKGKSPAPAAGGPKMAPSAGYTPVTLSPAAAAAAALITASAAQRQRPAPPQPRDVPPLAPAAAPSGDPPPMPPTPPKTPPLIAHGDAPPMPTPPEPPLMIPPSGGPFSINGGASDALDLQQQQLAANNAGAAPRALPAAVSATAACRVIIAIDPEITAGVDWRTNRLVVTVQMNQKVRHIVQSVQTRYRIDNVMEVAVPVAAKGRDYASMQPIADEVIQLDLTPVQLGWRPESYNWVWFRTKQSPRDDADPHLQQLTSRQWYIERVRRFYEFYDPRRMNTAESIIDDFENSEDLLIVQLTGKYGKEPTKEMLRQTRLEAMRAARAGAMLDATPQSVLHDRVSGREQEDENDAKERRRQLLEEEQKKKKKGADAAAAGGGRKGGGGGGGVVRYSTGRAAAIPNLGRKLEVLAARCDNTRVIRLSYFRTWLEFLVRRRALQRSAEFAAASTAILNRRRTFEKLRLAYHVGVMGRQVTASNIASNKSDSLVSDLQAENTILKAEVKKLQTQVELLDSTNARRLETLGNSSEMAISQIRALTQECQTKEALITKLEQKLMGIGNMALAAGEKKDFALKAAVAARMEMADRLREAEDRVGEVEAAFQQSQAEVRRLKKKSELRKRLLGGSGALRRTVADMRQQKGVGANDDEDDDAHEVSSSDDEGRGPSARAHSHGHHASATIAEIQKECKHCIHYSQQKFVIDAHQRAADENRDRIDDLQKALQRLQSVLNACEDENAALRREVNNAKGGGGGNPNTNKAATAVSHEGIIDSPPSHPSLPGHLPPQHNNNGSRQQQQQQPAAHNNNPNPSNLSFSGNLLLPNTAAPQSAVSAPQAVGGGGLPPPVPASIQAILGGGGGDAAASRALAAGLQQHQQQQQQQGVQYLAPQQQHAYMGMGAEEAMAAAALSRAEIMAGAGDGAPNPPPPAGEADGVLRPYNPYEGATNPTWGYGATTATPSTLVRSDAMGGFGGPAGSVSASSAPPRHAEFVFAAQQRALNERQRQLDVEGRVLMGAKGAQVADTRDMALAVGPKVGRSDLAGQDLALNGFFAVDAAIGEERIKLQMDRQLAQSRVGLLPREVDALVRAREAERRAILDGGPFGARAAAGLGGIGDGVTPKPAEGAASSGVPLPQQQQQRHINSGHYTVKNVNERLAAANNATRDGKAPHRSGAASMPYRFHDPSAAPAPLLSAAQDPLASFLGYPTGGDGSDGRRLRSGDQSYSIPGVGVVSTQLQHRPPPTAAAAGTAAAAATATSAAMGLVLGMGAPTGSGGVGGSTDGPAAPPSATANMLALMRERIVGLGGDATSAAAATSAADALGASRRQNLSALDPAGLAVSGERPPQGAGSRYKYGTVPTRGAGPMKSSIFGTSVLPPR